MKQIHVVCAVIYENGRILATQRGYGEYKDGWEFPGGKVEPGESSEQAIVREIKEELDTNIEVIRYLDTVESDYPTFHIAMDCYLCRIIDGSLELKEHESARWLTRETLFSVEWLPADLKLVQKKVVKLW